MDMNDDKTKNTIFGEGLTNAQVTQIIVSNAVTSDTIRDIELADEYYEGHNKEIEKKTNVYYDKDGKAIPNPKASNVKHNSQFLRVLVQQKQDYGFAKTFNLKVSTDTETEVDLKTDPYGKRWKDFCDGQLFKLSYKLAGQAVNHGLAWAYVWIDGNGEFKLKDVPSNLVYPVWTDRNHEALDRLVYNYTIARYDALNPIVTEYAEYWDDDVRELFSVTDGYRKVPMVVDDAGNPVDSHMVGENGGVSWGRIPFIVLKGTDDERTLLSFIKRFIDTYDMLDSRSADGLLDDLDPLLIFKGVSPDVNDLLEAREIAKMTRTMSLDTDGDAYFVQAQTQIDAYQKKMESIRRDIIKFGYGVDYEDLRFNGNPNQMVIKSLYQNLDGYTDGLERHFQDFVDDVKYFFDKWWEMSGFGTFEEAQKYKVLVKLDRSMMINISQMIEDTARLRDTGVSQRTIHEYNPVVQDVDVEEERVKEERREEMREGEVFDFGNSKDVSIQSKQTDVQRKDVEEEVKNG